MRRIVEGAELPKRLVRPIVRLSRLDRRRRALLAEALVALAGASAAIRFLPFRRAVKAGARPLSKAAQADSERFVAEAVSGIEAVAARVPWRAVCFQKGVALQWMLRRRGIDARLHYGVGRDEAGALAAHVWIAADGMIVIGGEQSPRFRSLAVYP
jgi:hypothetical protein